MYSSRWSSGIGDCNDNCLHDKPQANHCCMLTAFQRRCLCQPMYCYNNFLLSSLNITTLAQRRRSAKILTIFKLKNHLSHSINSPLQSPPLPSYFSRNYSPFNLIPIHCKSSSYFNSFYPSSIKLWNSLPVSIYQICSFSLIII